MSPKRPGGEGEPDNIDFALEQIKIDTEKARIMPTREQFRDLAQKVRALALGRGYAKATPWEKYSADLSVILQMLPRPAAREINARTAKFCHGNIIKNRLGMNFTNMF